MYFYLPSDNPGWAAPCDPQTWGSRRPGNTEGLRDLLPKAGAEGGPRGPGRAVPAPDLTARETQRKPRPRWSAPAPRRGGQGEVGRGGSENRGAAPLPELGPPRLPVRLPVRLLRQEVPAPQLSRPSPRWSCTGSPASWCWCPAAVSDARPRARHPWGRPGALRLRPPDPSPRPQCRRAGWAGAVGPVGGAGRVREEASAAAGLSLDVEGSGGSGVWKRAGEPPFWRRRPVPGTASPDGFTYLVPRRPPAPRGPVGG